MPQTAVIYARYSSHQQRDVSIEQQVDACLRYAQENDLDVLRVYADRAMTGTNDNRPDFQAMIRDSASRAFSFVIVYSLDRFSRDRYDSAVHKHTLKEHGVRVLSAMENIQDNPTGVLMESILEGFAEYYSKELAQKIRRGQRSNAEKCLAPGSLPLGYKKGGDGRYEIVPEEAAVVREIYTRIAQGELFASIYEDLNRRGITTKHGRKWTTNSFSKLLSNERYVGVYEYAGVKVEGGVPPILERELYDRVQARCRSKANPRGPQKRRRETGVYLLTGKVYCGYCRGAMVGTSGTGKHGELHYYYACRSRIKGGSGCKKKSVPRDRLEDAVARAIQGLIFDPENAERIAEELLAFMAADRETEAAAAYRSRIAVLEKERANTLRAIRQGVIAPSVQDMLTGIEDELADLSARLALEEDRRSLSITKAEILAILALFRDGDMTDKVFQERLFDAFLVRAYVYDDRVRLILNYTGIGSNELDVPLEIENLDPPPGSDSALSCPLGLSYPNPAFIQGLVVVDVWV